MKLTFESVEQAYTDKKYLFNKDYSYQINIFGIRSKNTSEIEFSDILGLAYFDSFTNPVILSFPATTNPALYWINHRNMSRNGAAILVPGQYENCWMIGKHNNIYEELVQKGTHNFKVWRNFDTKDQLDKKKIYNDVTVLNVNTNSIIRDIDKQGQYNAGCQIIQHDLDFQIFLSILKKSASLYGSVFSYTLFEEKDFKPLIFNEINNQNNVE